MNTKTIIFSFLCMTMLTMTCLTTQGCLWSEESLRIERFEFLDAYLNDPDSLMIEKAYLVHGFSRRHEKACIAFVDRFACDSIAPTLGLENNKFFAFYKASFNTNRENFQGRIKNKITKAMSDDITLRYSYTKKENKPVHYSKFIYGPKRNSEMQIVDFWCE